MVRFLVYVLFLLMAFTSVYATEPLEKSALFTQEQQNYLAGKKTLVICVDPKWRPYEWIDERGIYRGIGADYFHLFVKNIPLHVQLYRTKNWAQSIDAIKQKKCDVLPMVGITKERKKFLNFTSSYFFTPYVVATTNDKSFIEDFSQKIDKKYAVIRHSAVIDSLTQHYGKMNFVPVDTVADGLRLVENGDVFGFINTAKVISYFIQEHSLDTLKIDAKLPFGYSLAVATRKDEPLLRDIFQRAIEKVDKQQLKNIRKKWYAVVLDERPDYTLVYEVLAVFFMIFLALLYRANILRKANRELEKKVYAKTRALQKLNAELEQKVQERTKELKYQAYYDQLTSLPNRTLFGDRLHLALEKAKRSQKSVALFFIDLDMFKQINDSLGHHVGDEVLKIVAARLLKSVRSEDTLARLGGDEFTLILEDVYHTQEAVSVAKKMLQVSKEPIIIQRHTLYISLSIGIAFFPQDATSAEDLLKNADAAMYKAKEGGRNRFEFYSHEVGEVAYEKMLLQSKLRVAIEQEDFEVFYQPQIDLLQKKIVGFEALVRWRDSGGKIISPAEFLPLAEETGCIVEIDSIVMKKALFQMAQWRENKLFEGHISLNLAAKELSSEIHLENIMQELEKNGLPPSALELEITESDIMRNPERAIKKLEEIHSLGIRISIDDFGTGYSSLAYLKRFPIDKLKIDQSFVRDIPEDEEGCGIVKAVIALGKTLGMTLIAEGVEQEAQKNFLLENGCSMVQGYYYAKPLCASDAEYYLQAFSKNKNFN